MKKSIILATVMFVIFTNLSHSKQQSNCSRAKDELGNFWTQKYRSQVGDWIQFLGKGIASSKEASAFRAEGQALHNLLKECLYIHQNVKFHERCTDRKSNIYISYARVSVKRKYCLKESPTGSHKKINKRLTLSYERYVENYLNNLQNSTDGCDIQDTSECVSSALFEITKGNKKKGLEALSLGCQYGDFKSCFELATFNHNEKKDFRKFANLACELSDELECFKRVQVEEVKGNYLLALTLLKKSCSLRNDNACVVLSSEKYSKSRGQKSKSILNKACEAGLKRSCFELSKILKNKKQARSSKERACKLGLSQACSKEDKEFKVDELEKEFGEEAIKELDI